MFYLFFLHKIVVYRQFSYFQYGSQNGRQKSRDYLFSYWFYILASFCVSFTAIALIVLEILCVEPINPQYLGVLKTWLALRNWLFEVLCSESVNMSPKTFLFIQIQLCC